MRTKNVTVHATDGTEIVIGVPLGALPSKRRVAELKEAFDRVADPSDWKAPIDKVVRVSRFAELDDIVEAIEFYTGTSATIEPVHSPLDTRMFRISAVGYYLGPAN